MTQQPSHPENVEGAVSNGALRLALQRCEAGRLLLLLEILAATGVLASLRHFTGGKVMQGAGFTTALMWVGGAAVYAWVLLVIVRRATERGTLVPMWVWAATVVVECSLPSAGILLLQESGRVGAIEALTAPVVLMYGAMITLSILRMRPWICLLAGAVAAVEHAALFARAASTAMPPLAWGEYPYHLSYPVNLLITGAAAALIAGAVRGYFLSSLREAEARRQLDRVQHELGLARSIQRGLLPAETPHAPGYDIAGWSQPADETGGDYYDWLALPDGRVVISIADATGHGIGPALVSCVCRAYFRAATQVDDAVEHAVARVNDLITADLRDGSFVTAATASLDPQQNLLHVYSAGHGPLLYYSARERRILEWESDNVPLGLFKPMHIGPSRATQMEAGDLLLLLTDGFFEWANPEGEQYGIERLRRFVEQHGARSCGDFIAALYADVLAFARGTKQHDDLTAVAIKRVP